MYTYFGSECPFGMGVSGRRPPSCVRGAPTVLKGAEAAARTAGTAGSTRPARGAAASGTAAEATTPGATACCTGGSAASTATAAASGTCAAVAGASRSASTGSGSTHHSPCAIAGAAAARPTWRTACRSTRSLQPSSCTHTAAVKRPLRQPTAREHTPLPQGGWWVTGTESWRDRIEHILPDTRRIWASVSLVSNLYSKDLCRFLDHFREFSF